MVIARKDGINFVILSDGEFLPQNLNSEKVVVFRQGNSTNRELKMLKPFGQLAPAELIKPPDEPVCNYNGDGNPLHQHKDETWWFYEESWAFENGPYPDYETGLAALEEYCREFLAAVEMIAPVEDPEREIVKLKKRLDNRFEADSMKESKENEEQK